MNWESSKDWPLSQRSRVWLTIASWKFVAATTSDSRQQICKTTLAADHDMVDEVFSGKDDPDDHVPRFE